MTTSAVLYVGLVVLVAIARLVELRVASRHLARALARGGVEHGAGHYPAMVALHSLFLLGCVVEVLLGDRPFLPWLAWPMLGLLVAAHALRWWCVNSLGDAWTTRVVVVPGDRRVAGGPYRWISHPNYVAVALEGLALPLVHTAWLTAGLFTVANAVLLLRWRLPAEERALTDLTDPSGAR